MTSAAELAEARTFLSGWTLSRYLERFRAESVRSHARSFSEDEGGDGVTPCCTLTPGGGAFGWSRVGPPSTSPGVSLERRRPNGVLTLPSDATVGQALRSLAASDLLAAPAVDRASLEHRGFITCADLLRQLLRSCYPRLLAPDLLSEEDMEALFRGDARGEDTRPTVDAKRGDDAGFAEIASDAEREFQSAWRAFARVGDDGDVCFAGFDDTTFLDFVSRGLDCRRLEDRRRGDFEPGHRVAVFAERAERADAKGATFGAPNPSSRPVGEDERARFRLEAAAGTTDGGRHELGGDFEAARDGRPDAGSRDAPFPLERGDASPPPGIEPGTPRGDAPRLSQTEPSSGGVAYLAVVSQLNVIDAMVRDADALGAFVRLKSMSDLGFVSPIDTSRVVCVTETLPTAAAFAVANNCEVSATPVLDASRRFLLGSVSVSDARVFRGPEDLRWLNEPVGAFLWRKVWPSRHEPLGVDASAVAAREAADDETRRGTAEDPRATRPSAMTVPPRASLLEAMRTMSRHRVHRVYVCDSPRAPPRGVCTATDVMRVFAVDPETAEGRARLTW